MFGSGCRPLPLSTSATNTLRGMYELFLSLLSLCCRTNTHSKANIYDTHDATNSAANITLDAQRFGCCPFWVLCRVPGQTNERTFHSNINTIRTQLNVCAKCFVRAFRHVNIHAAHVDDDDDDVWQGMREMSGRWMLSARVGELEHTKWAVWCVRRRRRRQAHKMWKHSRMDNVECSDSNSNSNRAARSKHKRP